MEVPILQCTLVMEKLTPTNTIQKRDTLKNVFISLVRNEFRDIIFQFEKNETKRKIMLKPDQLVLHRKFVKEGKVTIHVKEQLMNLMLSNAPPHQLSLFVKSMAAKLAGNGLKPAMSARRKLLSSLPQAIDGISPVTQKDVENLKRSESTKSGLLKMNSTASPVSTGRAIKRKRLTGGENKENETESKRRSSGPFGAPQVLTHEQRYVIQSIKGGKNVFFTGGAGTGKSFLIRKVIGMLPPDCTFVTASTGVAAYQIGGITLHSFAGIGSGATPLEKCIELAKRKGVAAQWKRCKHLIIDEISMVDGKFFEKLETIAREVRGVDKPFGGIQLILSGDFLQLPPVARGNASRTFCFETSAWMKCGLNTIELTDVKRQNDQKFIEILKMLRMGKCSEEIAAILTQTQDNEIDRDGIVATKLCTHTDDVQHINATELENLKTQVKVFVALDSDQSMTSFINSHTPVDANINLKVGAQVMLMKNQNVAKGLVNGARGCVVAFGKSGQPIVKFVCGAKEEIQPEKWVVKGSGGKLLTRKQVPLRLAWAFSIHKSQGMTLDCVEMSLERVFEAGQAYVALSRAKDLKSIRITNFSKSCIRADTKVLRFYRDIRFTTPQPLCLRQRSLEEYS